MLGARFGAPKRGKKLSFHESVKVCLGGLSAKTSVTFVVAVGVMGVSSTENTSVIRAK